MLTVQAELLQWRRSANAARTFLTHGEEQVMRVFVEKLVGEKVETPKLGQEYEL